MPSFFSRIASRTVRGSSSANISRPVEPSVVVIPSTVSKKSQSPAGASGLSSSNDRTSPPVAPSMEPFNPSPELSGEVLSLVPSITPSEREILKIADAPEQRSPSPSHSTSSLAHSDAANSPQSGNLLGSYHSPASQSTSSVASSDISSQSESSNQYNPSRADVIATRGVLLRHFPSELVAIILDAAEYYPHCIFAMPAHHFDHPLQVLDGRIQAVLTLPIVDSEFISRVVIRTESHDQGWSSYPNDQGTFNNSWTWLDLALVRNPNESTSAESPPNWRIYTNLHASRTWQNKEVALDKSYAIIGALRSGDSLAIWAEARSVLGNQSVSDSARHTNYTGIPDG